ncbi:MAG: ABC transporter permease [Ktedonobacterales bacterium]
MVIFAPLRRTLALALRIIEQFRRDRRSLALLFLAPLLVMTILNFVLNSSSNTLTLAIVAPDGPAGTALVNQIQTQMRSQSSLAVTTIGRNDVDATLKAGDADGALIFPADFAQQRLTGQPSQVKLRLEGSNPTTAKQLKQVVSLLIASLLNAPGQNVTIASTNAIALQSGGAQTTTQGGASATAAQLTLTTTYLYGGPQYTQNDALAPLFIGLFSFFFVFLLASVAFLRERSQGTLERLMVSPLSRSELTLGYVLGFTLFALLQSLVILFFVVGVLRVHFAGNLWLIFLVTLTLTIGGVNMGIFASAFARNELQVIQFIPLLLVPQVLLGGLFFPVKTLPIVLKQLAYVMPLTYANFALQDVMLKGLGLADIWPSLLFLVGFAALMVAGAAFSLRQERG